MSAITAPFRKAKLTFKIKLAAAKILKALKLAKVAKIVATLKHLKKSPIVIPVPVVVPVGKQLPSLPNFLGGPTAAIALASATGESPTTEAPNQINGLLTTATKAFEAAGAGLPLIAAFQNNFQPTKDGGNDATPRFPSFPNLFNIPAPSLSDSLGPIQGIISGAQKALQSAGNKWS